ncbi:uncharacterized protein LOC106069430 isoform X2 [Biomphalaria glabrata]|uniref:Uncharacterized protein LOC106069430 isoform X2 n=1 Tax=Biomphalaria glabrata TaxID=6526 RepID=A0A9W3AKJ4_BIOGL|nr:uncharacterized protein LOC106069430 isoform X2 [Biomphalaria glabrata]
MRALMALDLKEEIYNVILAAAEMDLSNYGSTFQFECGGGDDEMSEAAEKLVQMGDGLTQKYGKKDCDQLIEDITQCLLAKSENINQWLSAHGAEINPTLDISATSVLSGIYVGFREKLGSYLFSKKEEGKEMQDISLVVSIAKGVCKSLHDSPFNGVSLAATLASNFIAENYQQFLLNQGGLFHQYVDSMTVFHLL